MFLWLLGMVTIWTTRGSAIFETYIVAELLLSGRLVPLPLMPDWAQTLADWLPVQVERSTSRSRRSSATCRPRS